MSEPMTISWATLWVISVANLAMSALTLSTVIRVWRLEMARRPRDEERIDVDSRLV